MAKYLEQTQEQSEAIRTAIRRNGVPMREETEKDGTRRLEWRIGTHAFVRRFLPDGTVA